MALSGFDLQERALSVLFGLQPLATTALTILSAYSWLQVACNATPCGRCPQTNKSKLAKIPVFVGAGHAREQKDNRGHGPLLHVNAPLRIPVQRDPLRMMRLLQVVQRLHLGQAAGGAGNFAGRHVIGEHIFQRHRRARHQPDMVVVKHIDQPGEAPRLGGEIRGQLRDVRHEHRGEAVGDLQVIGLRVRAAAQLA